MGNAVEGRPRAEADAWVRSAFQVLTQLPGVLRVGVALSEGGGRQLLFAASDRGDERAIDWCKVDAYEDVPLNNTVRTGDLVVGSLQDLAHRYPEFVGGQARETYALASVPVSAAGQVLGGFALFYATRQPFDDPQLRTLQGLGESLGEDLRRGQFGKATLSRSLVAEPAPTGARTASHIVAADPHGVAPARQFVRRTLMAWGVDDDSIDTAVLCVSELVTNAIIHTVAGCQVRLVLHEGVLTATVRDGGRAVGHPFPFAEEPLAVQGRGLRIVEALSSRWGSEVGSVGITAWCEFDVDEPRLDSS